MWEPLPWIAYGYATHPLTPSRRENHDVHQRRLSTTTIFSTEEHSSMRDVVSLEVGDEIYAFEKYIPAPTEPVEGEWYRGYVVCTTRLPPVNWISSDGAQSKAPVKMKDFQQAFIGIFPASHVYFRDEKADAEGLLPDLANSGSQQGNGASYFSGPWSKGGSNSMDSVREEEDETDHSSLHKPYRAGPPLQDQLSISRRGIPIYSMSLRSASPTDSSLMKPNLPRPSRTTGGDTASGAIQPIIDEIASALREWHLLMYQYLARRDYKLFQTVRGHIDALHLGRRQLLAHTLSAKETVNMRRDCVDRLVHGNLVQGLDIIVRHPTWGGLVTVDIEGHRMDERSWLSAVRMYDMQVALAYLDVASDNSKLVYGSDYIPAGSLSSPLNSTASERSFRPYFKNRNRSQGCLGSGQEMKHPTGEFYHVFLDMRAFVASPCSPGETAELFFSLCKKQGQQFITEEFCAILNHNGVLARDPTRRIRTLFVDLSPSDIQEPVYLVCRIVRNGAFKMGSGVGSGIPVDQKRNSDASASFEIGRSPSISWIDDLHSSIQEGIRPPQYPDLGPHFRRPFGCSVIELTQLNRMLTEQSEVSPTREFHMPIFVPTNETSFSMIHQNIINNNTKEYEKSARAEGLAVSLKFFRGDAQVIVKENTSLLQDTPQTLRLGFPDVVFPGDSRNELYIKLWSGEFPSSHSGTSRISMANLARGQMGPSSHHVQVTVEVRDQNGMTIGNVISQGSGEPLMTRFHSIVFQRCLEPTFGELIKVRLPPEGVPNWHLFFTFKNRSARERLSQKSGLDASDKPFAFAFQPLFPDAFVEDGSHILVLYRSDKTVQISAETYLCAPFCSAPGKKIEQVPVTSEFQKLAPLLRDTFTIRTCLCSTKHTHNQVLSRLMNWQNLKDKDELPTLLKKFTFVGEGEIVKFLRNIFDSLFSIFVADHEQTSEMSQLVFNALVFVLGIVQDRRFNNFQPVLDVYIEEHFNFATASSHIIQAMDRLLENPSSAEYGPSLRSALKVWRYIFKFITRSRELQKAKEMNVGGGAIAEHLERTFKIELRHHLSEVTKMMSISSQAIVGTQTIALQHFTSILPELAKMFSIIEVVSITTTFANAVSIAKGKIILWKLIMYLQVVKSFLFDNPVSRPHLVEAVVIWIKPHFGRYDEFLHAPTSDTEGAREAARMSWLENIRLCVSIIAAMLDKLQQSLVSTAVISNPRALQSEQNNVEYLLSLLPRLLDSYVEFQNPMSRKALENARAAGSTKLNIPVTFPETYPFPSVAVLPPHGRSGMLTVKTDEELFYLGMGETAVVMLVLILSSPIKHILDFLESSLALEGTDRFVKLLLSFFKVGTSIINNDAFPKSWLNINVLAHKVLLKMMDPISTILEKEFIPPPESEASFDPGVWCQGMHMLLKLLSSEQLAIEDLSPQNRRAVWRLAGDIRSEGAIILLSLWQALGWAEQSNSNGMSNVRYGGYQVHLHPLVGHVVNLCLSPHELLRTNGVQILFSMIVSVYSQHDHFDDIEFELVTQLDTMFMSDSKGDDTSETHFIRDLRVLFGTSDVDPTLRERVTLFLDSVDLFLDLLIDVRALPAGEEYADDRVIATLRLMNFIRRIGRDEIYIKYVHQLVNMHLQSLNYVEAALTLKLHADLYDWDLNTFVGPMEDLSLPQQSHFHRKETLYLLVLDYLGNGKAWETAIEICKELAFQHGEITYNYERLAEILRHQATLLGHIINDQRYYPDYFKVTFYGGFPDAIREKRYIYRGYDWERLGAFCERMLNKYPGSQLLKTTGDPTGEIRNGNDQYIQCSAVTPEPDHTHSIFTNPDVPLAVRRYYENSDIRLFSSTRLIKKMFGDVAEEWTEKTYYTAEEVFPTVLRRSEIVDDDVVVEISPLEKELEEVLEKTRELSALNVRYQALAKTTQPVSTNALAMCLNSVVDAPMDYRRTFFDPEYVTRYPDRATLIVKLQAAIDEQVRVIDSCLKLHGHLCSVDFISFHDTLEKFYRKNFRDEIRRLAVDDAPESISASSLASTSLYRSSIDQSVRRSVSSSSTARGEQQQQLVVLPPLQLGRAALAAPSQLITTTSAIPAKQSLLQRHLAHLTRHGMTGVASAPDATSSDSPTAGSPQSSFANGNGHANGFHLTTSATPAPGASGAASHMGSLGSIGSLKIRLSRFGSLNFRRGNNI